MPVRTLTLRGAADMSGLQAGFKKADALTTKFVGGANAKLAGIGSKLVGSLMGPLAAVAGAAGIGAFFGQAIKGASDLAETSSKVSTVFGPAAAQVEAQAKQMAAAFGLPKGPLLDAAASIGLVGKAAGQTQGEAATMANQMARLAADASSFYNVPLEEALGKIRSGLVGEAEPLRAFGVMLSEAAVGNEAMALGLSKTGKDLDESAKVMARASLITKGLKDASGDLERTQGGAANQFRKISGTIQNMTADIGTALLPAVQELVPAITGAVEGFARFAKENQGSLVSSLKSVVGAIGDVLGLAGQLAPAFSAAFQVAGAAVKLILLPVQNLVSALRQTLEWAGLVSKATAKAKPLSPEAAARKATDDRTLSYTKRRGGPGDAAMIGSAIGPGLGGALQGAMPEPPKAPALPPVAAATPKVTPAEAKNAEEIKKTIEALKKEQETLGMTEGQLKLYEMRLAGATEAQLKEAGAIVEATEAGKKRLKDQEEMTESVRRQKNAMIDAADAMRKGLRTPAEKVQADIDEATELRDSGDITGDEYGRRLGQIKKDAEPKKAEDRFAGAMEIGSKEAYSAILKASGMGSGHDTDAQRQTTLLAKLLEKIDGLIGATKANKPVPVAEVEPMRIMG